MLGMDLLIRVLIGLFPDNPPWTATDGIWLGEFTLNIRAKALIDQIFDDAGLTYTSDFFDTADFANIYMPAYNGTLIPRNDDESDNRMHGGIQSVVTGATSLTTLPITDAIGFDASNNFDNSTHQYTAPFDLYVDLRVNLCWRFSGLANVQVFSNKTVLNMQNL